MSEIPSAAANVDPWGPIIMTLVLQEPFNDGLSLLFAIERVIARRTTKVQRMVIADTETYGRALFLDDLVQSTAADEALYHEPFVHPALCLHGAPRRVLVGGAGEGATLREVLRHPTIERVVAVDLDLEVVAACREHMPQWSDGAFEDPRVTLREQDIRDALVEDGPGAWDIILLDVTDPVEDGPSQEVFSVPFFERVATALADDGIAVVQSGEIDPILLAPAQTVQSTLRAVFPWVCPGWLWVPSFHGLWSVTLVGKQPRDIAPPDLAQRIAVLPSDRLRVYDEGIHRATFALPKTIAAELRQPGRVLTGEQRWAVYRTRDP